MITPILFDFWPLRILLLLNYSVAAFFMKQTTLLCFIVFFLLKTNILTAQTTNHDETSFIVSENFDFTPEYCDKEVVVVPDYIVRNGTKYVVDKIPFNAFKGYKKLKKVTLPTTIDAILDYAFSGCENLEEVIFPENCKCTDISFYAFEGCKSLKTITLPYNTQQICENAFYGCENLQEVHINACIAPILQPLCFDAYPATLYVPKGCLLYYYTAPIPYPYSQFFTDIKESDYRIPETVLATLPKTKDCYTSIIIEYGNAKAMVSEYTEGPFCVPKNTNNVLRCVPKEGFKVSKLTVNDINYTDSLKHQECRLWVKDEDITINVETEPSIYLTLCQSESGAVRFEVPYGERHTLSILPSEGWTVHSVTFNDEVLNTSITDGNITITTPTITQSSVLNIAFEKDNTPSSNPAISSPNDKLTIYATDNKLIVENIDNGEEISVYNAAGTKVKNIVANNNKMEIILPPNNLYLVRTRYKTIKIRMI